MRMRRYTFGVAPAQANNASPDEALAPEDDPEATVIERFQYRVQWPFNGWGGRGSHGKVRQTNEIKNV